MPSRILREGILTSDRVNSLSAAAEVFYRRLMSVVDDFGRFDGRPSILRVSCYPLRVDAVREADLSRWIAECVKAGLLVLYAVDGKPYLEMQDFRQQTRAKSKFPPLEDGQVLEVCEADDAQMHSVRLADAKQTRAPVHLVGVGVGGESGDESEHRVEPRGSVGKADPMPRCKPNEVIELYHEVLPELPKVRVLDDKRKRAISEMWRWILTSTREDGSRRAETYPQAMEWLRAYFDRARANDFIMGRTQKAPGHEGWKADIEYLMSPKGLKQVLEKTEAS